MLPSHGMSNTVESPNKGHFGTNINSSGLSPYRDCPLLKDSNCIILVGGIKFKDLVLSIESQMFCGICH